MAKKMPHLFVVCSLMMSVRCVQGLFTAQTLTRWFATIALCISLIFGILHQCFYFIWCTWCRSLRQMWNCSSSQYVERLVTFHSNFLSLFTIRTAATIEMQHVHSLNAISPLQVYRLRLLGDYQHNTRIAFVEFVMVRIKNCLACSVFFKNPVNPIVFLVLLVTGEDWGHIILKVLPGITNMFAWIWFPVLFIGFDSWPFCCCF